MAHYGHSHLYIIFDVEADSDNSKDYISTLIIQNENRQAGAELFKAQVKLASQFTYHTFHT